MGKTFSTKALMDDGMDSFPQELKKMAHSDGGKKCAKESHDGHF
jgi:hypothetical protein